MQSVAQTSDRDYYTRAANDDCFYGGSSTRTKYGYDTAKRVISETTVGHALSFQYDAVDNRTQLTWPDGNFVNYDYDALNRVAAIRENGATAGVGVLASYTWDPLSRPQSIAWGNATATGFGYDLASRLITLSHDLLGTTQDVSWTLGYTTASQLQTRTNTNSSYGWAPNAPTTTYVPDGLNRYTTVGGAAYTYDGRGNLTSDGTRSFTYDVENHLLTETGGAGLTLTYDPIGRLAQSTSGTSVTQFLYGGDNLVAEYSGTTVLRRYVHGPGTDTPVVWYEGPTLSTRNWLHRDERGSIVAASDGTGAGTVYTYGPYGEPDSWSGSRFRYTGQIMLPEAQLYHYKARVYDPGLGRFLQTDPVGQGDDLNLYTYTGNDPLNGADPSGTAEIEVVSGDGTPEMTLENLPPPYMLPPATVVAPRSAPPLLAEITDVATRAVSKTAAVEPFVLNPIGLLFVGPFVPGVMGHAACEDTGTCNLPTTMAAERETLTGEEQEAVRNKKAGKPYDKKAFNRARQKQIKNEKYAGQRNSDKQRGGG